MPTNAKLFSIIDIIAVTTGILIDSTRRKHVNDLTRHVTKHHSLPATGSKAREDVVEAVQLQLPSELRRYNRSSLVDDIMAFKFELRDEERVRSELIKKLRGRFGYTYPFVPTDQYSALSSGLELLRAIAVNPTEISVVEAAMGNDRS